MIKSKFFGKGDVDVIYTSQKAAIETFLRGLFGKGCLHCNQPNLHASQGRLCLCNFNRHHVNCYYTLRIVKIRA